MAQTVTLISCGSRKLLHRSKAKHMYVGPLFKYSLEYALLLTPDHIFILSAKHGLLSLEQEIEPYDQTLNRMTVSDIQMWADKVLKQIEQRCSLDTTQFVLLAGQRYRKYLEPHMQNVQTPLAGLTIGKQLQKLKLLCHE